ncbi:hypothetical protein SAMN05216304_10715 [Bosea sp. OK403]|uniref:hypothetical protein n=1 Tax=Bosea sp. OK403 TaxID=1855286 RepID=UPI0008EA8ED2|nr:hypothetical protein [Bosea sp. OK403]SFJ35383.1 hypothetical protein SAMN05216304_10715 [Bosea sp. OK403]
MATYEASLRRRREAAYQATRRNKPLDGIARALLQSFAVLLLLAGILAVWVHSAAPR